ncbi:sphingomyelin phosphodiesterase 4-like [Teleopsis dalmanni]|uniref:sphingomyelin phosphodiesterase 4-like n=1 Tax=Teleopsis dalmanni TaxID=139649 RepID=UPI0018CFC2BF|nr:sphingomyelin phosphodiesterase 4-like [Teleopsis dalmanni]
MVDSIFGMNLFEEDWGIFNPSRKNETALKAFLGPNGLLLRTACDLVANKVRLHFNHDVLPKAMQNNLIASTGFYDNLVELNENRTEIVNFSINPFEYYMVCFASAGVQVYFEVSVDLDNEQDNGTISFYQTLATEYFNMYLPTSPTAEIVPCMSNESMRPYRKNTPETPVLCLPILGIFESLTHKPNISFFDVEDFRVESVLRFFMDIWFCNDIKSTKDLPSAYFLKLQREFIKHISAFSIPYKDEGLHMICVRENSLYLLKNRFHSYIWKLFRYWPLDKTYIFVLKLWLRYLEPWAAEANNQENGDSGEEEDEEQSQAQLGSTFIWNERVKNFFKENLTIYTQIFVDVLPCLEKLDYFSDSNMQMLKMVVDFFGNENFMLKLKETEQFYLNKLNKEQLDGVYYGIQKKFLMVTQFQDWDQLFVQSEYVPAFHTYTLIMFERIVKSLYNTIIDTKMKIIDLDTQIDKVSDSKPLLDIFVNTRKSLIRKIELEMATNTETLCKLTYILDNLKETIFQVFINH